ncbi:PP2C family protein-serine/threonine phosphatase [Thermodesulfobacteriota bacterium]
MLGEVNRLISSRGLDAMTTAAVVAYYREENVAKVSYAGHPPVLYRRAAEKAWSFAKPQGRKGLNNGPPMNIPLSVEPDTPYGQLTIPMTIGDQLFVYTDGIIDAPSPGGEPFGLARLKDALDANEGASLSDLKSAVLETLNHYTEKELSHDDVTLIALEIC